MCMQCAATAMAAGGAVTGVRAWLAVRRPAWLSEARLKRGTAVGLALGVVAAGALGGIGSAGP